MERLRRRAGKVRDCDVLLRLGAASGLDPLAADALQKRLLPERKKHARKLLRLAKKVSQSSAEKWAKKHLRAKDDTDETLLSAARSQLSNAKFDQMGSDTLHEFRLSVKPLRYRAEMLSGDTAQALARRFDSVQSSIGDWHDLVLLREKLEQIPQGLGLHDFGPLDAQIDAAYRRSLENAAELLSRFTIHSLAAAG
ncbi:MAG: hypothetical protein NVS9B15_00610 [Acidobacteriaceae bacterium]